MRNFVFLLLAMFAAVSFAVDNKKDVCLQPTSVTGVCQAYMPSYSYNPTTNECIDFIYGGCGGNGNRFPTKEECEATCKE